jgi:hypothetical protein
MITIINMSLSRRRRLIKQEINADKPLTEEQARDYLECLKKGDLSVFADRIWARQSTKEDRLKRTE